VIFVRRGRPLLVLVALSALLGALAASAGGAPRLLLVTVVRVTPDNSSAKIDFAPVPGAADYRVFDVASPKIVKYAGAAPVQDPRAFAQTGAPVPSTEIEWNLLEDGKPHTLVIQAVDRLGPFPPANAVQLAGRSLQPLVAPLAPGAMLGANAGDTPDGRISINGQGPSTNRPRVIAQSRPFVVRDDPSKTALPSRPGAAQVFFDRFADSEAGTLTRVIQPACKKLAPGMVCPPQFSLGAGTPHPWTIKFDVDPHVAADAMPMVQDGHFMDVLPTAGLGGATIMSPLATASFSGGRMLHVTMEVDLHLPNFRWLGFAVTPASDPFRQPSFDPGVPINGTEIGVLTKSAQNDFELKTFVGPGSTSSPDPGFLPVHLKQYAWGNGLGVDDRSRLDLFMTQTHAALFENGVLVAQGDLPGGLAWAGSAQVSFYHEIYSAQDDLKATTTQAPWEVNFLHNQVWTDERHWDNMGFEVLPASAVPSDWSTLAALVR
jgi:hypothetical protein